MSPENILILGGTGSIGDSAIDVIRNWPERFRLIGFSYHNNFEKAKKLQKEFSVKYISCGKPQITSHEIKYWASVKVTFFNILDEILYIDYDRLVTAVVGSIGVWITYKAAQQGKTILIANKESLVMAGEFIMEVALKNHTTIIPVDSEHNSLFRLMNGLDQSIIQKVYLTASGGPFYLLSKEEICKVKKEEVLAHPNWDMGAKISVDSAGMINKALEIMEAHHLFQFSLERIDAVIHPQSYVHAIIQYKDGTCFFHGSEPDMRYPISHSLFYPDEPSDWIPGKNQTMPDLQFAQVDHDKYPGFSLGLEAAQKGGVYPAIFNASNERAVEAFLNSKIKFHEIPQRIEETLSKSAHFPEVNDLEDLFEADRWARSAFRD